MTDGWRETNALEAYLRLLRSKGADEANLSRRRESLSMLLPMLAGRPSSGMHYREAVDVVLEKLDRAEWPFFLMVSREYFYFWMGDLKAIAALHSEGEFEVEPPPLPQVEDKLKEVWKRLDTEKFSVVETWPLKAYVAALREEGADKSVLETRAKLVKLLLIHLRGVETKSGKAYRAVVESLLPLFAMKETRYLFLAVVREFFYFWMGDPDAATHIRLERSD
ncbi:MAG: hypothetical protein N2Z69_09320 [Methylophilaceae bacterium]|nr:hypothetical protein [Methylophilaceae bacterium]